MNLDRGFLRLWIAASVIFVCSIFAYETPKILEGFSKAREQAEELELAKQPGTVENFLTAGEKLPRENLVDPWPLVEECTAVGFGIPLGILLFGLVSRWIARGFVPAVPPD